MEFNFEEFINESKRTCRYKLDFAERIRSEIETVPEISDGKTYIDRLKFKHQLELTMLALKCGALMNKGKYNNEIMDLLDSLED